MNFAQKNDKKNVYLLSFVCLILSTFQELLNCLALKLITCLQSSGSNFNLMSATSVLQYQYEKKKKKHIVNKKERKIKKIKRYRKMEQFEKRPGNICEREKDGANRSKVC